MAVVEMRELLASYPADLRVVVNSDEGGHDDLSPGQFAIVRIVLNTGMHDWEEQHGEPDDAAANAAQIVDALVLRRASNGRFST